MILSFKTQINGKPTYFVDKIWRSIWRSLPPEILDDYVARIDAKYLAPFEKGVHFYPKLHTIRTDEKNRWKEGVLIDFFINSRQKDMFRFAPRIPVVSTQKFTLFYFTDAPYCYNVPAVYVDEKFIDGENLLKLAQNDGFEDLKSFFEYFNEDFEGKIIHWTDLRY